MGYKLPKQIYKLIFPKYAGLQVRITAPTIGEIMTLTNLIRYKFIPKEELTAHDTDEINHPQRIFAKHLVEWNLTDDVEIEPGDIREVPVPATLEGVKTLPTPFFQALVQAWIAATSEVEAKSPLVNRSKDGMRYPEESIPMVPLSPNLSS